MQVRIDRVEPDDWRSYRHIRLEMLLDAPDAFWFTHAEEAADAEAQWRQRIAGAWIVVARQGDDLVGSAGLGRHWEADRADSAVLFGMYVAPRARRSHVGERLVRAILEQARRQGAVDVVLEVADDNRHAIALYERCGFVPTGAAHPHPRRPDLREIEMRWRPT